MKLTSNKKKMYLSVIHSILLEQSMMPITFELLQNDASITQVMVKETTHFVYAKYASKPSSRRVHQKRWSFKFHYDEILKIEKYYQLNSNFHIFFHLSDEDYQSEICALTYDEFKRCIGDDTINKDRRIAFISKPRHRTRVYGTKIADTDAFIVTNSLFNT